PLAYNGPPTGATLVRQPTAGPWHDGIAAGPDGRADAWPSGRAAVRFAGWTQERLERCTTGRPAAGPPSPCLLHGRHAVADDPPSGHGIDFRPESRPSSAKFDPLAGRTLPRRQHRAADPRCGPDGRHSRISGLSLPKPKTGSAASFSGMEGHHDGALHDGAGGGGSPLVSGRRGSKDPDPLVGR